MTFPITCPICGSTFIQDEHFKNASYTGKYCQNCHTAFGWPIPSQKFLDNWYAQPSTLTSGEVMQDDKLFIERWKQKEITLSSSQLSIAGASGRMLDVGCHLGIFANEMRRKGLFVSAVDPNPQAIEFARNHYGLDAQVKTIDSLEYKPHWFDVVTMWDVIEHLSDPVNALKKLNTVLRPGGLIGLATPNRRNASHLFTNATRSLRGIPLGSLLDPPRHLYAFDRKSISVALDKSGFDVIRTWTLDTYETHSRSENVKMIYRFAYGALYQTSKLLDAGDRLFVIARKRNG